MPLAFVVGATFCPAATDPFPAAELDDTGMFTVSVSGKPIGSERFEIRSDRDGVEAEAKIELRVEQQGKTMEFKLSAKLVLNSNLQPLTYTWSQKGPQSSQLTVDLRTSPAKTRYKTVTGEDDQRDFELPKDVVILDDNVFHQYQLLLYRFLRTPGKKQTFRAFVPQEALPGVVELMDKGQEPVEVGARTETLRHLVLTTELKRIDLWADNQGHVQRISIPDGQLEALRE